MTARFAASAQRESVLLREDRAGITTLTLNRPRQANALSDELLAALQAALDASGLPTQLTGAPYATDGGDLAAAGLPVVVLGPGDIAQAHADQEWLDLQELERGVRVYRALMEQDPAQLESMQERNHAGTVV